jgi:hypothetical protein
MLSFVKDAISWDGVEETAVGNRCSKSSWQLQIPLQEQDRLLANPESGEVVLMDFILHLVHHLESKSRCFAIQESWCLTFVFARDSAKLSIRNRCLSTAFQAVNRARVHGIRIENWFQR